MIIHVPRRLAPSYWGGTERVLEETLPALKRLGLKQAVFTSMALEESPESLLAGIRVRRFEYSYPEWPLHKKRRLQYDLCGGNLLSRPLKAALSAEPALQVIHCHTGNRLAGQCLQVAERRGVASVVTLHGGHFAVPPQERLQKSEVKQSSSFYLNWGKICSAYYRTRSVLSRANAVVCVGIDEYEAAKSALPDQIVRLLPGGVNLESFAQGQATKGAELLGLPPDTPYVVSIARLDAQKDQLTLVKAMRQMPNPPYLVLVGPETTPGYGQKLKAAAAGTLLAERLLLTGSIPPQDVPHLLAGAQVAVLPSIHEPFGLSIVEAWAAGTPLIASRVGGPAWLLKNEQEGLLFEAGQADELFQVLSNLLKDQAKQLRLKAAGLTRAPDYTWDIRAESLKSIYEEAGAHFSERRAA